ncbi:MAG: InlB B-repeat-containing protein [Oscillospiraceae bacterium]|jgi:uncharacterized repeat protein (TIGR02543 family)|nr:InlB B-repeat-containing protein [Oscillospiraceae bacterium]
MQKYKCNGLKELPGIAKVKKLGKRGMGLLLAMLMLASCLSVLTLFITPVSAQLSKESSLPQAVFAVPETVWLAWNTTGSFSSFGTYSNVTALGTAEGTTSTQGKIYFSYAGATNISISCANGASVQMSQTGTNNAAEVTITGGSLNTAVGQNSGSLIQWRATFTAGGTSCTIYNYTYCYAPSYKSAGAAGEAHSYYFGAAWEHWVGGILMMRGFHNVGGGLYSLTDAGQAAILAETQIPNVDNARPTTHWLTQKDSFDNERGYDYVDQGSSSGDQGKATANVNGGTGYITVDTSRFSNLKQVPNLYAAYVTTDDERSSGSWRDSSHIEVPKGNTVFTFSGNTSERLNWSSKSLDFPVNGTGPHTTSMFSHVCYGVDGNANSRLNLTLNLSINMVDKSGLRQAVLAATNTPISMFSNASNVDTALRAACTKLGNPREADFNAQQLELQSKLVANLPAPEASETFFSAPEVFYTAPTDALNPKQLENNLGLRVQYFADQMDKTSVMNAVPSFGNASSPGTGQSAENTIGWVYFYNQQATNVRVYAEAFKPTGSDVWDTDLTDKPTNPIADWGGQVFIRTAQLLIGTTLIGDDNSRGMGQAGDWGDAFNPQHNISYNTNKLAGRIALDNTHLAQISTSGLLRWRADYKIGDVSYTAYTYSYIYTPYIGIAGAAVKGHTSRTAMGSTTNVWIGGISWWVGAHSVARQTLNGSYAADDSNTTTYYDWNTTGSRKLQTLLLANDSATSNTDVREWLSNTSAMGDGKGGFAYISQKEGNGYGDSVTSPDAFITIDRSRYSNLKQIPNLSFNIMTTDMRINNGGNNDWSFSVKGSNGENYKAEQSSYGQMSHNDDKVGWNVSSVTDDKQDLDLTNTTYFKTVTDFDTATFNVRWVALGKNDNWGTTEVRKIAKAVLQATFVNKANLRTTLQEQIKKSVQQRYVSNAQWTTYINNLNALAQELCQPDAELTAEEVTTLTNNVNAASNAVSAQPLTAHANHFSLNEQSGYTNKLIETESMDYQYGEKVIASKNNIPGFTYAGYHTCYAVTGNETQHINEVSSSVFGRGNQLVWNFYYTPNTYSITYSPNGGSGTVNTQTCQYDQRYPIANNTFTRAGYTFNGWNTAVNGSGTSYTPGQSVWQLTPTDGGIVQLYAQWIENTYYVQFHRNPDDNTDPSYDQRFTFAETKQLTPNTFIRTGYTFLKWNTAANGTGTNYNDQQLVSQLRPNNYDVFDLYAQWTPNTYNVTYNPNNKLTELPDATGTVAGDQATYDANYTPKANDYEKYGWYFTTWNTKPDGGGAAYPAGTEFKWEYTSDITLYAQWSRSQFTVTFVKNDTPVGTHDYTYEDTFDSWDGLVALNTKESVKAWYSDAELTKPFNVKTPITKAITVYAQQIDKCPPTVNFYTKTKTDGTTTVLPALPEDWTTHLPYYGLGSANTADYGSSGVLFSAANFIGKTPRDGEAGLHNGWIASSTATEIKDYTWAAKAFHEAQAADFCFYTNNSKTYIVMEICDNFPDGDASRKNVVVSIEESQVAGGSTVTTPVRVAGIEIVDTKAYAKIECDFGSKTNKVAASYRVVVSDMAGNQPAANGFFENGARRENAKQVHFDTKDSVKSFTIYVIYCKQDIKVFNNVLVEPDKWVPGELITRDIGLTQTWELLESQSYLAKLDPNVPAENAIIQEYSSGSLKTAKENAYIYYSTGDGKGKVSKWIQSQPSQKLLGDTSLKAKTGSDTAYNRELVYVRITDRFGNVVNSDLLRLNNHDARAPIIQQAKNPSESTTVTITEQGGAGFNEVSIYQNAYDGGVEYVRPFGTLLGSDTKWSNCQDSFAYSFSGPLPKNDNRVTILVTDKAGNSATTTIHLEMGENNVPLPLKLKLVDGYNTQQTANNDVSFGAQNADIQQAFAAQEISLPVDNQPMEAAFNGQTHEIFALADGIVAMVEPAQIGDSWQLRVLTTANAEALLVKDLATGAAVTYRETSPHVTIESAPYDMLIWTIEGITAAGQLQIFVQIDGEWLETVAYADTDSAEGEGNDLTQNFVEPTVDPALPPEVPQNPAVDPIVPNEEQPAPNPDLPSDGESSPQEEAPQAPAAQQPSATAAAKKKSLLQIILDWLRKLLGLVG